MTLKAWSANVADLTTNELFSVRYLAADKEMEEWVLRQLVFPNVEEIVAMSPAEAQVIQALVLQSEPCGVMH